MPAARAFLFCMAAIAVAALGRPAMAVTFTFTFNNGANHTRFPDASVTGTVSGLLDNATGPGIVVVTDDFPGHFASGPYTGNGANSFTLANGAITGFDFFSQGSRNTIPAVACCSLVLTPHGGGLSDFDPDSVLFSGPVTFTPVAEPAPIPLPGSMALLLAALGSTFALARRRTPAPSRSAP